MTSHEPHASRRSRGNVISLVVAGCGIVLGVGGAVLGSQGLAQHPAPATPSRSAPPAASSPAAARQAGTAAARPLSAQAIYARVEPSVVDVTASLRGAAETASGTGFVLDEKAALVVTNNHVIRDATTVTVTVPGTGRTYPARVVGADGDADVAVLRIAPVPGLAAAPIGDSGTVRLGVAVVAIGNEAGANASPVLADGVITGISRTIQAADGAAGFTETLHGMLATTARIEPGDSGGPLASSAGTVIGMDTAAGTDGAAAGYAIPINTVMAAARKIASLRGS